MTHKHTSITQWLLYAASIALFLLAATLAQATPKEGFVEIPVLKTTLRKGTVIETAHLSTKIVPEHQLSAGVIRDKKNLMGKEVTRTVAAFMPLYGHSISLPPLVRKNKNVLMMFERNGMILKSHGRALENGIAGQTIKMLNNRSGNTVFGTVVAKNTVKVN